MVPFCIIDADTGRKERLYLIFDKKEALRNPEGYRYWGTAIWNDKRCALAAVQYNGCALNYASDELRADREVVLAAVKQNGMALEFTNHILRADREVVLAAVRSNGNSLKYAHFLQGDCEVVLAAVQQDGRALQYARDPARTDYNVVLAAVRQNGAALLCVSETLRANREIVLAAVRQNGRALVCANDDLQADRELVLTAVQQCGYALEYVNEDLRADREVVLAAVRQKGDALRYANESLRQDVQFVRELTDICPPAFVWQFNPQITEENVARTALKCTGGIRALIKQANLSLLTQPNLLKELLISSAELGCLRETVERIMQMQKQKRNEVIDTIRTVLTWYGAKMPNMLPSGEEGADMLYQMILGALIKKR